MTDYESGKVVAQTYSHDIGRLLKVIYDATIEPRRVMNQFERGVIDEVSNWDLGEVAKHWKLQILKHGN